MMVYGVSGVTDWSACPVTVTVWGTFQFACVNFRRVGEAVPAAGLLEERSMVTSAVGWPPSTTVTPACSAASFDSTFRDTRGGVELEYITGEQCVSRLNQVLGPTGWSFVVREHGLRLWRGNLTALGDTKIREKVDGLGGELIASTPANISEYVASETEKWAKVIKFAGLKAE